MRVLADRDGADDPTHARVEIEELMPGLVGDQQRVGQCWSRQAEPEEDDERRACQHESSLSVRLCSVKDRSRAGPSYYLIVTF